MHIVRDKITYTYELVSLHSVDQLNKNKMRSVKSLTMITGKPRDRRD